MILDPSVWWIAAGLALLVAEVLAPGVFLMWLGLAAIGTGLVELATAIAFGAQTIVYTVFAVAGIAVALRLRKAKVQTTVNTAETGLVGRTAHALAFEGSEGRVRLGDSDWPARMASATAEPASGERLEVTAVDGMTLVVRRPREIAKA